MKLDFRYVIKNHSPSPLGFIYIIREGDLGAVLLLTSTTLIVYDGRILPRSVCLEDLDLVHNTNNFDM